jgi:hypothetical protein
MTQQYEPRDIRQIKLISGDEILAEVLGEDAGEYLIYNPLKVLKEKFIQDGSAKEANFFVRWMGFANNQEFILNRTHVITEAIVDDSVADYYNKMMASIEEDDSIHMADQLEDDQPDLSKYVDDNPTFH